MSPEVQQALSALLPPLRFAQRAGLHKLKAFEPLVREAVAKALPHAGEQAARLRKLLVVVQGFDEAGVEKRRTALEAMLRELQGLLEPSPSQPQPSPDEPLAAPVTALKGVGPAVAEKLISRGYKTVGDLLLNLPRRYEDRRKPKLVAELVLGEVPLVVATIVSAKQIPFRGGRRRLEVIARDARGGELQLQWFNFRASQLDRLRPGSRVAISGEVKRGYRGGVPAMHHPDVETLAEQGQAELGDELSLRNDDSFGRVVPIYSEIDGLPPRTYRRIAQRAVEGYVHHVRDLLPEDLRARRHLMPLERALRELHFPEETADEAARDRPVQPRRRLAFEEFFAVQLGLALRRQGLKIEPGIAFRATPEIIQRALLRLPWPPTNAQRRAIDAIAADMQRPEPMNRLLQGDVGSGKTAVALVASLLAVADGYQAALMAPTEILAEQHLLSLRSMLKGSDVHVELLVGSLGNRERAHAERLVRGGAAHIVVGTHALAEENTAFHKLGLAVIDEQHRFGVMTRAALMSKGARPDVLVMTATPIPRTLALTLYGDLDSSIIDEMPPGRTPISTKVYRDSARDRAYEVIKREIAAGHQAYVVLPLVEESDKLADVKAAVTERDRLAAEVFPGLPVGLVHGQQSTAERNAAMERFRRGEDKVLVATTVIEVGVDVPNATVMLVEHAERFGLSQLHQLRGRVGRGAARSHCLLVTGTTGVEWGPDARARLQTMEETQDGFKIAEADLELRGPGEFLGTRQSGMPDFAVAELARDQKILAEAREEAFELVKRDPDLSSAANRVLRDELLKRWRGRLSLARVG